jgi:diguanylate cyclase (GGDEF)-like protein
MRHMTSQLHAVGSIPPTELTAAVRTALEALDDEHRHDDAVDAALDILHERVEGMFVAALALEHDRLWIVRARGYTMIPEGLEATEGIVGRAVSSRRPQFVGDVSRDADFVQAAHGVASELALPLSVDGEIIGVLNIETSRQLPRDAARIVHPLAEALAPAVDALRGVTSLDLSALARFFVYVGSLRDPRQIADVTARAVARALPLDACHVVLEGEAALHGTASWVVSGGPGEPLSAHAIEAVRDDVDLGSVFRLVDLDTHPVPELIDRGLRSVVLMPLRANGIELGTVIGVSRAPLEYRQRQAETAALVVAHAGASIESALMVSRERQSALTDALTGLVNRRGFHETLDAEIDSHHEDRAPISLVVMDLDDFKEINDRAGHEFGDALLREIGVVLPAAAPADARTARLGGDEFVIMLPDSDVDEAGVRAEELRERLVAGLADAGFPVHVSFGVATYPFDGGSGAQLLRAADQALYEAKAMGKGRVVRFRDVVARRAGGRQVSAADRRREARPEAVSLTAVFETATAIARETDRDVLCQRLAMATTFVAGATACVISRVDGPRLVDVARHSLRDIELGDEVAYLIAEFPLTKTVLDTKESRSISFLDEDLDQAEAFVLRELRMNCCLLVPIVVDGEAWGLVEVYDMRLRRFADDAAAAIEFLTALTALRLEELGALEQPRRRLPLFRLPATG